MEKDLEEFISEFENLVVDYCFTLGMGEIVTDTPRDRVIEIVNNFVANNIEFCIAQYLVALQSGKLGVPTLEQLQDAGMLHSFLEKHD